MLLQKARVIATPGIAFGEEGEGYMRFALVQDVEEINKATSAIKEFFQMTKQIRIGLLGFGTVGSSVYDLIEKHRDSLRAQIGADLVIEKIAVRDLKKSRKIKKDIFTDSVDQVVTDPNLDIIVELMGGTDIARDAVLQSLENEKQVASANKALIALHGEELISLAEKKQRDFLFEACRLWWHSHFAGASRGLCRKPHWNHHWYCKRHV